MTQKMKKWLVLVLPMILIYSISSIAFAEDHENDEHHEKSQFFEKTADEPEHHDENEKNDQDSNSQDNTVSDQLPTVFWYIWSRQPINNPNNPLPVTAPADLSVRIDGKTTKVYVIPQEGQLLVSGKAVATVLGAKFKYYPQSKILVLLKNKLELIVRADSNAAYENKAKTPMPVKAAIFENTIYLPVSVAANALGYRITWNQKRNTILFTSF